MIKIYLLIKPEKISWLKFILEGYDGLGMVTTIEQKQGLVFITCHKTGIEEVYNLLSALSPELSTE